MSVFTNPATGAQEHAAAYVTAILDLLGSRDPVSVLRATPSALHAAIDGVSADQLRRPEKPGKWSIAQVLQHLADSDLVWGWRIRLVLSQDRPTLIGYDQDAWAEHLKYDRADAEQALKEFAVLRQSNLRLIRRASPQDLQRVGIHSERGEESVSHMMRLYAGHDLLHLNQIARIRATL